MIIYTHNDNHLIMMNKYHNIKFLLIVSKSLRHFNELNVGHIYYSSLQSEKIKYFKSKKDSKDLTYLLSNEKYSKRYN